MRSCSCASWGRQCATADYLRETSMSTWGVPKGLWLEAKEYRKLTGSK